MAEVRTYRRPMPADWWTKNPFYVFYMLREASAVFFFLYALLLLWGLYSLSQGEAAYQGWRALLATPVMIAFHAVAAAFALLHTITWFMVLPKTAPTLRVGGKVVPDLAVVVVGVGASAAISLFIYAWVAGLLPPGLAEAVRNLVPPGGAS
ncbi:MAG: fumarate reductase subunit C [Bacteroidales bacterium]|nr:fumarate reductase subunit C [Bacteroidales bacterium]